MTEIEKQMTEVTTKLEEVNLEVEEPAGKFFDEASAVNETKRNSLSKFFSLRAKKAKSCDNLFGEEEMKVPKPSNTFSRLFSKKPKSEIDEAEAEVKPKRSNFFRNFANYNLVPWIGSKKSQCNIHKPEEVQMSDDDESPVGEIATESRIF
ncbi:CLUMA_CG012463, isoform A [Clunio marinus]|uniref:CLUMA_CG012463, isoform A n=1 Tax=Clunio marinus TaxID=568069 RepID=A0A1J1IFB1_9DIPT|nr:CLUMA_CG012463, isoform A [Clunio marinus]